VLAFKRRAKTVRGERPESCSENEAPGELYGKRTGNTRTTRGRRTQPERPEKGLKRTACREANRPERCLGDEATGGAAGALYGNRTGEASAPAEMTKRRDETKTARHPKPK